MKTVTIHIPDEASALVLGEVDVNIHFRSDLAACEAFAKYVDETSSLDGASDFELKSDGTDVDAERVVEYDGDGPNVKIVLYGPDIIDRVDRTPPEHKPRDLLHARMAQLRAREADERAEEEAADRRMPDGS